ncbi:MAG TPA: phosphate ABC transporter permease subunit PstC [Alphaproteobacteria bacterium]|nr:phosphate ABC transporter permease subunit PstC [Alphaproteobacteria bacterium]
MAVADAASGRTAAAPPFRTTRSSGRVGDRLFYLTTLSFAILVLLILAGIMVSLAHGSWPAFHKLGFAFFYSSTWNPVTEVFGALPPIYGTLVTSIIAILIGVPISLGIVIVLTELAPDWLKRPISTAVELLAAIPSIIYGMWGLFVFVPFFKAYIQPGLGEILSPIPIVGALFSGPPFGVGILTAGIILAVMILPFISAVMRDVFETVPPMLRESAYGLGATTWEVVWNVILPYTRTSVVGAVMLGLGRALGETMAVTFVIGNSHDISASLFLPGATISSTIANEFTEAVGDVYSSSLIALGLTLFFITFVVLVIAKLMLKQLASKVRG